MKYLNFAEHFLEYKRQYHLIISYWVNLGKQQQQKKKLDMIKD
jgi:hypothetical protein